MRAFRPALQGLVLAGTLLAVGTGCSTKIRNITAEGWSPQGVYVGYWEGTCKPFLGCDVGDGHVQFCSLDDATNTLTCVDQAAVLPLLDRKAE